MNWQTARLKPDYDLLAPDGSEIRLLVQVPGASLVHCTLQPGQVTRAVRHRSVEEVWFCTGGSGELWRRCTTGEELITLAAGTAVSIPLGTEFQFRATSAVPLQLVLTTVPPWPGEHEAIPVEGRWQPTPA